MASSRLPGCDVASTIQKVADNVLKNERAESALSRASAIVRSKGLSAPVIERVISSNSRTTGYALKVLEAGLCGQQGAAHGSAREATGKVGIKIMWRAAVLASYLDIAGALLSTSRIEPSNFCASAWATAETASWISEKHIVDPCDAFACAALLDVGLLGLVFAIPDVYYALRRAMSTGPLVDFEQAALGFDHQAISELLLKVHRFPAPYSACAAGHHGGPADLSMEGKVVQVAVLAVESVGGDCGLSSPPVELSHAAMEGALLKPEDRDDLQAYAAESLARAASIGRFRVPEAV